MSQPVYLLMKRGLYWRPNDQGYTGLKSEAGRYTYSEAFARTNYEYEGYEPVTMVMEQEAPRYAPGCASDVRQKDMEQRLDKLEAENKLLKEKLSP